MRDPEECGDIPEGLNFVLVRFGITTHCSLFSIAEIVGPIGFL
jgi:hypothetical protein